MRRALSRIPRLSLSSHSDSLPPLPPLPSASLPPPRRRRYFTFGSRAAEIPCGFVKRASLGCCRGSRFAAGFTPLQPKALGSIIDLGRAENCSPDDLVSVWDDYHLGRGHIGASMKANLYHLLEQRSATCRHFVIPLWRGSGYTTMFIQVQMPHILITGLEDYKARGTQASPYFTVTHYTEFAESKGVVLIRGDVVFTSKLNDSEAKWLQETTHSFYLNDVRYKLVEQFNKETHEFEFKNVLRALEMPTV
ncbi:ATP synthase mitochondrial F1 complex assembly factor 1 [Ananas comosus]|uniref:ATP synthase mitochondrial F1 complex assembly factor 1 n=1 Tax=Ananas comosus TaxID=4615 RepID=A0A6P5F773_ANACO|nr:ATP synthase mitochondrial F1 complex assembly factor 1 [Ananas comosus]